MYKKKAKLLHPDKSKLKNKELREKNFRILQECYIYIKKKLGGKGEEFSFDTFRKSEIVPEKTRVMKDEELSKFNQDFMNSRATHPGDFGYNHKRMEKIEEYGDFDYKPTNIFGKKKFDPNEFNKMFEHNKQQGGGKDMQLVNKTTDGFYAYNSGGCDLQAATVSTYNGLMLVGDNLGESGVGYHGSNFGDCNMSFNGQQNPTETLQEFNERIKNESSENSKLSTEKIKKDEWKKLMNERLKENEKMTRDVGSGASSKAGFRKANEEFENKKRKELKDEIAQHKKMIMDYQNVYPSNLIEDAKNNRLEMSNDTFGENFNETLTFDENVKLRMSAFLLKNKGGNP